MIMVAVVGAVDMAEAEEEVMVEDEVEAKVEAEVEAEEVVVDVVDAVMAVAADLCAILVDTICTVGLTEVVDILVVVVVIRRTGIKMKQPLRIKWAEAL